MLGTSTMYSGRQNVTVVLTSNNAKVVGDTVRRCLRIRLNAKGFEDPTTRPIANRNLRQTVEEKRGALIASLLTIVRWHRQAGLPGACQLGSFEDWAQQVGGLVQTLTGLDPVASQAFLRENDLKEEAAHQFYRIWEEWFGGQEVTANRVYQEWRLAPNLRNDAVLVLPYSEICEIVYEICGKDINPRWFAMRVADYIDVQYGTRVMKRVKRTDHANIAKYQLVAVEGSEPSIPSRRSTPRNQVTPGTEIRRPKSTLREPREPKSASLSGEKYFFERCAISCAGASVSRLNTKAIEIVTARALLREPREPKVPLGPWEQIISDRSRPLTLLTPALTTGPPERAGTDAHRDWDATSITPQGSRGQHRRACVLLTGRTRPRGGARRWSG